MLVLTMSDSEASLVAAVAAGASGYVLKAASQEELLVATRAVADGQAVFGAGVALRLLSLIKGAHPAGAVFPNLTLREREILQRMARGTGMPTAPGGSCCRRRRCGTTCHPILAKLHAADRAEAVARARDAGLGTPGPG